LNLWKWDVSELHDGFKNIIWEYFESDILDSHESNFTILNYLEKLLSVKGNIQTYDNVIRNFCTGNVWSLKNNDNWVGHTTEYKNLWENISEYHYCVDQFQLHLKEIKKEVWNEKNVAKIGIYLSQLKELVAKLHRLKNEIHHELDTMKYDKKRTK
jgi:hypothetical protein